MEGGEGRCGAGSKAVQLDPELRTIRGESRVGLTNSLLVNGTSISPIVDRRAWGCGRKPHAAFASSGIASVGSPSPSTDLSSLPSAVDTRGCRLRKTSSFPVSFLLRPSPSLSPEIWREDRERERREVSPNERETDPSLTVFFSTLCFAGPISRRIFARRVALSTAGFENYPPPPLLPPVFQMKFLLKNRGNTSANLHRCFIRGRAIKIQRIEIDSSLCQMRPDFFFLLSPSLVHEKFKFSHRIRT